MLNFEPCCPAQAVYILIAFYLDDDDDDDIGIRSQTDIPRCAYMHFPRSSEVENYSIKFLLTWWFTDTVKLQKH